MGNKLKSLITSVNVPMVAFIAFTARLVYTGSTVGDAIALVSLAGVYGFHKYINRKDEKWKQMVETQIVEIKNHVQSVKMRQNARSIYEPKDQKEQKRYF